MFLNGADVSALFHGGDLKWAAPNETSSVIYIDPQNYALGDINSLTATGSWTQTFTNIAFAGGAVNVMEADGIDLNGNFLRADMSRPGISRITVICDITIESPPLTTFGDIIAVNPASAVGTRIRLLYGATQFRGIVPSNVSNDFWISPVGSRYTVGIEVDIAEGVSYMIGGDGEITTVASLQQSPVTIDRIELFKSCIGKCHKLAILAS